jgi:hypothetical protein
MSSNKKNVVEKLIFFRIDTFFLEGHIGENKQFINYFRYI